MSEIEHVVQLLMGSLTWNKGIPRTIREKEKKSQSGIGVKTGRTNNDFTLEWKDNISKFKKAVTVVGEKNPMFGKTHS